MPYHDPNRPDLYTIQDQFNDPETIALWRKGLLPEQIRIREEQEAKAKKRSNQKHAGGHGER